MRPTDTLTRSQPEDLRQEGGVGRTLLRRAQRELVLVGSIVVLAVLFGSTSAEFLTPLNIMNIVTQSIPILIIALGMTVIIISGGIDLSVGSVASLVGVVTVGLYLTFPIPVPVALFLGLVLGGLIGAINGLVITRLHVPDFIATLAMMTAARGTAFIISGGYAMRSTDPLLAFLYNTQLGPIRTPIVIGIVIVVLIYLLLAHTELGRSLYAVGGNRHAARLAGLRVSRLTVTAYVIGGTLTALSGLITSSRMAAGSPTIGQGWELQAVAIVIVGGANLFGGEGGVAGTVLAALLIGMINNWLSLTGLDWWLQGLVQGSLLITVVALNQRAAARRRVLTLRMARP